MNWIYIVYFAAIAVTAVVMGFISGYARRQRFTVAGAGAYMWVSGAVSLLAVCEGFSILSPSPEWAGFFFNTRFISFAAIPVAWLVFALQYTGKTSAISKRALIALCIVPALTQIVMWTNSMHGLWVKQNVGFHRIGRFFIADPSARIPGPWYNVHMLYTYAVMLAGVVIIFIGTARMFRQYRGQAAALISGTMVMIGGALIPSLNLVPGMRINPLILFFALGSLIVAWGLFRGGFLSEAPEIDSGKRIPRLLMALFITAAAAIVFGVHAYYRQYMKTFRDEAAIRLSAVAELKVDDLVQWRNERLADADVLFQNDDFTAQADRLFSNTTDETGRRRLETWLGKIQSAYGYPQIALLDVRYEPRMVLPHTVGPVCAHVLSRLEEIRRTGNVAFLDFHREAPDKPIRLAVIVPIRHDRPDAEVLGFAVLAIDPAAYLYPLLRHWPTESATAETLLVRRDGDDALILNDLRFEKNAALRLRTPLTNKTMPCVMAALGKEGFVEGFDRRGLPVAAAIRAVPDSPWFIVAVKDMAEVYAPLKERMWFLAALMIALLVCAGAGSALVWVRQNERFLRERIAAAETLHESEEMFAKASRISPYAITITNPEDGRILEVNEAFSNISGFSREEAMAGSSLSMNLWFDQKDREFVLHELMAGRPVNGREFQFKRKNGEVITGLFSADFIMLKNKRCIFSVINDITERKRAEDDLHDSRLRLKTIIESQDDAICRWRADTTITFANSTYLTIFDITEKEIGIRKWIDFVPPGDREKIISLNRQLIEHRTAMSHELPVRIKDGPTRWFAWVDTPIRDDQGRLLEIQSVGRDITERKRVEAELAAQLDELRRWQIIMLDREDRVMELKREVNELLRRAGEAPRYGRNDER